MLDLHGHQQWFSGLGEAGGDILLLGISLAEAHQFVDILYGRQSILYIGNRHFTVREERTLKLLSNLYVTITVIVRMSN